MKMNLYILLVALVLHNSGAIALRIDRTLNTSSVKENESSFHTFNRTIVEPQTKAESSDQDGDISKQIIGSSVVTSVSVILNGKEPEYADALGKKVPKPQPHLQVASPINLLNPDRYEFYTFDDHGELVKRLMTMQEIQSIVANGDGEGPTIIHPPPTNHRDPEKNVQDIVNSVQNVLNREVESTKNISINDSVSPQLDTPDVSSSWSIILPAIFGNTGVEIYPANKQQHVATTPDAPIIVEHSTKPNVKPSTKPQKKRKPGNKRKTTTRTTTTPKPNDEDSYQVIQEELGPNESVYTGLQKYQNIAAANAQNLESLSSSFYNSQKRPDTAKPPQNATIDKDQTISTIGAEVSPELVLHNTSTTEMNETRTTTAAIATTATTTTTTTVATTLKYKQKIKNDNSTSSTEASKQTITARPLNKKKKPTRQPGGQKRKPIQHTNNQKNRFTTPVPLIDANLDQKVNKNTTAIPSVIDLSIHKMEPSTHKPLILDPITTNKIADLYENLNLQNQSYNLTTEKPALEEITNFTNNNSLLQSPTTEGVILINQSIDNEHPLVDTKLSATSEKTPDSSNQQQPQQQQQQQQLQAHTNRYPIPQLINEYSPPTNINESFEKQDELPALPPVQQNSKDDDLNTKLSFDQIMESLKENINGDEQPDNTKSSASPQTTIPMLYGGVESFDKLQLLSASKKVIASTTTATDHQSSTGSAGTSEKNKPITAANLAQYEDLIQAFASTTPKSSYVEQTESNSIKLNDWDQLVLITQRPQILHSPPHTTTNLPVTVINTEPAESNNDNSNEMTTIAPVAGDELLTINNHQVLKFEPLYADVQEPIVTDITTTLSPSPLMTTYNPELDIAEQELQLSESAEDEEEKEKEEEEEANDTTLIPTTPSLDTEENTSFPHKIESLVVDKDSIGNEQEITENQKTVNSSVDVRMDDIRTQTATILPATGETNVKILIESTTEMKIPKDEIETLMSQVYSQISDDLRPSNATADDIVMDSHPNQATSNRLSSFAQINPSFQINSSTSLASSVVPNEVTNEEQTLPLFDEATTTAQVVVEFEDTTLNYNTPPLSNNDYIEVTSATDSESIDDNSNENVDTETEMEIQGITTTSMPAIVSHDAIDTTLTTTEHSDNIDMFSMTSIEPDIEFTTKLDSNTEHSTLIDEEEEEEEFTTFANTKEKDEKKELFEITTTRTRNNSTFNEEQYSERIPVLTTSDMRTQSPEKTTEKIDLTFMDTLSTNKQDSLKHQVDEDPYIKLGEIGGKARVPLIPQMEIHSELKDKEESNVSFITTKTSAQPTSAAVTEKSFVTPAIESSTASSTTLSTRKTSNTLKPVSYYKQPTFDSPMKYPFVQNFNWQQQQRPMVRPASLNNLKVTSHSPSRPPVKLDASPSNSTGLEASIDEMDEDLQDFSRLCNELAFTYWKSITSEKISSARSLIISPFALTSMLAMIFLGARGGTSGEMNEVLKLDDMVTFNPHLVFKNITESVEKAMDSNIATAAFVREIFSDRSNGKILQFFKEKTQQFYAAHVEEVNFHMANDIIRRRTNLLVKRHTFNKVHEYWRTNSEWVNGPLASISANLFQTDCTFASTHERDGEMFFQVHPSVRQRRLVPIPAVLYKTGFMVGYEPTIDASIVAFGKIRDTVSTIFVMPGHQNTIAPADSLQRLEKDLLDTAFSKHSWTNILTSLMQRPDIEVQLPRFSHRSFVNASLGLQKMGLKGLFKSDFADLRGLTGSSSRDIFLSDMIQINTFSTCGEEKISGNHHVEIYPAPPIRKRNKDVDVIDEIENDSSESIIDVGPFSHESVGREFFDDHLLDPKFLELPLPLRPRQARIPDAPRLRFDKPFLYFVRHNPTGVILFMGRFNPRLQP